MNVFIRFESELALEVFESVFTHELVQSIKILRKLFLLLLLQLLRQYEQSPNQYDPGAMEFQHARKMKNSRVKRRRSLKTAKVGLSFSRFVSTL